MGWSHEQCRDYFAFGSNMNPRRVRERGLVVESIAGARLHGFELVFNKQARDDRGLGRANIRHRPGSIVEGVLYRLVDSLEIEKMDRFEGTPRHYRRELVPVSSGDGVRWAWTYLANPAMVVDGLLPDRAYLEHLIAGGSFLSEAYLERLSNWLKH